jgi:hypothetical protein
LSTSVRGRPNPGRRGARRAGLRQRWDADARAPPAGPRPEAQPHEARRRTASTIKPNISIVRAKETRTPRRARNPARSRSSVVSRISPSRVTFTTTTASATSWAPRPAGPGPSPRRGARARRGSLASSPAGPPSPPCRPPGRRAGPQLGRRMVVEMPYSGCGHAVVTNSTSLDDTRRHDGGRRRPKIFTGQHVMDRTTPDVTNAF